MLFGNTYVHVFNYMLPYNILQRKFESCLLLLMKWNNSTYFSNTITHGEKLTLFSEFMFLLQYL